MGRRRRPAALAGGKGWQLAMMARMGVPVPDGFVLSAQASRERAADGDLSPSARQLRQALEARGWLDLPLALRSSAPQEDSAGASFAGIHLSCLNVRGADATFAAARRIWDSAATPQASAPIANGWDWPATAAWPWWSCH